MTCSSPNSRMSSFCRSVGLTGTSTLKWTYWWPRPEFARTPRPSITRRSPGCVPGGSLRAACPSSVGTTTRPPSTASASVRRTMTWMSNPSRTKSSWSLTRTSMYKSPGPAAPASPLPRTQRFIPVSTPAGIGTSAVSVPSAVRHETDFSTPTATSSRSSTICVCTSLPRRGPRCRRPWPPKSCSKMSLRSTFGLSDRHWKPPPPGWKPWPNPCPGPPPPPPPPSPAWPYVS
mmetsp:Transcript_17095/g.50638  ORF Transcript_17095/g.50638 Transcript_17095/m.50638 type:complete len:232 (-) Transcript_17095:354-1049(-)